MQSSKKIFLSGASGFIGKNLVEHLGKKYKITTPSHSELNLLDSGAVEKFLLTKQFDIVIHAANIGGRRDETNLTDVYQTNKKMFLNLAEKQHLFGRMIFFGSGAEYGKHRPIIQIKESEFGQVKPQDEYGQAKYAASEYIQEHENIVNLRCFGVFGKYENYTTRFISNAICLSLAGQPITIKQNVIFDYVYVNDLAKVVDFFIKNEPAEKFYNVGSGKEVQLLELAQMVKELTKNPYHIKVLDSAMGNEYTCDNSKLLYELKNFEFIPIKQAITKMIDWYKINWQNIDQTKLTLNI